MSTLVNIVSSQNGSSISLTPGTLVSFGEKPIDGFTINFLTSTSDLFNFSSSVSKFVNASGSTSSTLNLGGAAGLNIELTYKAKNNVYRLTVSEVPAGSSTDLTSLKNTVDNANDATVKSNAAIDLLKKSLASAQANVTLLGKTIDQNAIDIKALKDLLAQVPSVSRDLSGNVNGLLRPDGSAFLVILTDPPQDSDELLDGTLYIQTQ